MGLIRSIHCKAKQIHFEIDVAFGIRKRTLVVRLDGAVSSRRGGFCCANEIWLVPCLRMKVWKCAI